MSKLQRTVEDQQSQQGSRHLLTRCSNCARNRDCVARSRLVGARADTDSSFDDSGGSPEPVGVDGDHPGVLDLESRAAPATLLLDGSRAGVAPGRARLPAWLGAARDPAGRAHRRRAA